ncbi:hypothetical protein SVAN01_08166 [Stagonosporopsis vannaccii]|nr:hypothetical protein SVAN01_08166 [Stagonosporopsis vannaccii]
MGLEIRTDSSGEGPWVARVQREDQCERSRRHAAITADNSTVQLSTLGGGSALVEESADGARQLVAGVEASDKERSMVAQQQTLQPLRTRVSGLAQRRIVWRERGKEVVCVCGFGGMSREVVEAVNIWGSGPLEGASLSPRSRGRPLGLSLPAYVGQLLISRCQQFDIIVLLVATTATPSLQLETRRFLSSLCMLSAPRSFCPHFFCSRTHSKSNGNGEGRPLLASFVIYGAGPISVQTPCSHQLLGRSRAAVLRQLETQSTAIQLSRLQPFFDTPMPRASTWTAAVKAPRARAASTARGCNRRGAFSLLRVWMNSSEA